MRNLSLVLLASLLLVACNRPDKPTPSLGATAPTTPAISCQPTVRAPSLPQPLPPAGLTQDGFYDPLYDWLIDVLGEEGAKAWWKWFTTESPEWGKDAWGRLDAARKLPPCA